MARRLDTLWTPDPHTLAKHAIVRRYLQAWLPIMTSWNQRVLIIDGFAGPGRYATGEDGSPVVALKTALQHSPAITAELVFLFIEKDDERKANLEREISALSLPDNYKVIVHLGTFDETVTAMLDKLDGDGQRLAPSFAFVDPFGWSQTPFSLVQRLLANPKTEVLVNFMYEEVNRFLGLAQSAPTLDRLFGCAAWRDICSVRVPRVRRQQIHDLYEEQLRSMAQARYVRSFEMRNERNAPDYFLFFATRSDVGHVKMKEAMWAVDRSGGYSFSDATQPNQPVLFQPEPDTHTLRRQIVARFTGQQVSIEDIERFVCDETAFLPSHYKRRVLAVMEAEQPPSIKAVSSKPGRRRGQFPPGTRLRFT